VSETRDKWAAVERLSGIGTYQWQPATEQALWSEQLFRLLGYGVGEVEPSVRAVLARVHPADRTTIRDLVDVQRGAPHERTHTFRVVHPDGTVRTLLATVGSVTIGARGESTLIGTVQDVTDAQLALAGLQAHLAVSHTIGTWDDTTEPLVSLLEAIGSVLGCRAGSWWVPDAGHEALDCVAFWAERGSNVEALEQANRSFRFPASATIGKVLRTRAPVIDNNLSGDPDFIRQAPAAEAGLRSWVAFPALHGAKVLAVAELFSDEPDAFDTSLKEALGSVGHMLGECLAWRRSQLKPGVQLTARELEVLQHAADGIHRKDSGVQLDVSADTIKSHFRNIYEKLGVADRAAAVAEGMRLGLIR
jgi:DNA-binding CsgD family transcriptional regulator